ncbi:MAG: prolipoprotein diacylglyceryl transferase [Bacilli bacterium]|nr:prolipoprotein diacylglyceryl transferase [Bacilli bacterium]
MKNWSKKQIILFSLLGVGIILLLVYVITSLLYKYPGDVHTIPKSLNPIFLQLGPKLEIRWYAICLVGGAGLLSVYGYYRYLKPAKLDSDTTLTGVTFGILFGILGGRLYYVLFNHSFISFENGFFDGLIQIINPASGGLAIHGALYGAIIFIIVYTRIKHFKLLETIEIVLPVFMLAQVVGRWGNFFNQEAFGPLVGGYTSGPLTDAQLISQRETLRHLLVPNFIIDNMYITSYVRVAGYYHPTFFYEGVANLIGALAYIEIRKRSKKVYIGDSICFYLTWYGIVRLFIELLRQDPLTFNIGSLTIKVAVLTSVLFILAGIALFVLRRVLKFYLKPCNEFLYGKGSIWYEGYGPNGKLDEVKEEKEAKLILFDCDGTIIDTFELIQKSTMKVFDTLLPDYKYTMEEINAFFGPLLDESFRKYTDDPELIKECIELYRKVNSEMHKEYVHAYDGIKEILAYLKEEGFTIVIVSNKVTVAVEEGLKVSGIEEYFDYIMGAEQLPSPKPNPEGIYIMMEKYGVKKALLVGDTKFDIECAKNVQAKYKQFKSVGVTWCQTSKEEFAALNADYIIEHPSELKEVIKYYDE